MEMAWLKHKHLQKITRKEKYATVMHYNNEIHVNKPYQMSFLPEKIYKMAKKSFFQRFDLAMVILAYLKNKREQEKTLLDLVMRWLLKDCSVLWDKEFRKSTGNLCGQTYQRGLFTCRIPPHKIK